MARKPQPELLEPGTEIVSFTVLGRAVPWSAPTTTRSGHAYKNPALVTWQQTVNLVARSWKVGRPYEGPVRIDVNAYIKRKSGASPDVTNVIKAIEDSLQNAVIKNDRQVRVIHGGLFFDDDERARITVYAWGEPA